LNLGFDPSAGAAGFDVEAIGDALEIDPNNAIIQSYYVEILTDSGFDNYGTAAEQSRVALALDPNIVETHRARGYLLARVPDPDPNPDPITNLEEAVNEYNAAMEINTKFSLLHLEQGQNYRNLSLKDKAIEQFTLANTLDPSDPQPDYLISRTYATFGEYEKALQYADTAVQNNPVDSVLRANLGVMYFQNFKYEEAVQELGLAIYGGTNKDGGEVKALPLTNSMDKAADQHGADDLPSVTESFGKFDKENFPSVHDVGKVEARLTLADNMSDVRAVKGAKARERGFNLIPLISRGQSREFSLPEFRHPLVMVFNRWVSQEAVAKWFLFEKQRNLGNRIPVDKQGIETVAKVFA